MIRLLGVAWSFVGIAALLIYAIVRLSAVALDAFTYDLDWRHWLFLAVNLLLMAYSEGYKGFQTSFAPRVAARMKYLYTHPRMTYILLGPLFCIGYFHISKIRRRSIVALTTGIIVLIVLVRLLDQPWRGLIDAGVVVGLSWGLVTVCLFCLYAFLSPAYIHSPEVPE